MQLWEKKEALRYLLAWREYRLEFEAILAQFEAMLAPEELAAAWQADRSLRLDQAIDEALRDGVYPSKLGG